MIESNETLVTIDLNSMLNLIRAAFPHPRFFTNPASKNKHYGFEVVSKVAHKNDLQRASVANDLRLSAIELEPEVTRIHEIVLLLIRQVIVIREVIISL
ncbi:hypothetical protein TNCT_687381 [Trichonephila clavata]|uniref:Uncharacterized protein n=1 Tax=Trichonephila clavata TaxID=2740835 RepID=A0A8X6FX98_TRICU|nr:hypothetical protein TNCT_687381 [Trichonephila clavata]